jgi:hypothetical protein
MKSYIRLGRMHLDCQAIQSRILHNSTLFKGLLDAYLRLSQRIQLVNVKTKYGIHRMAALPLGDNGLGGKERRVLYILISSSSKGLDSYINNVNHNS